jgi:hypothetical protein
MKSARDFYYEYYEKSNIYGKFQDDNILGIFTELMKTREPNLKEELENAANLISNFKPKYSNDFKLEGIFNDMLGKVKPKLKLLISAIYT